MKKKKRKRRALISVWDKKGIVGFSSALLTYGLDEIVSTGGTMTTIEAASIPCTSVEQVTGVAEMIGGRVKTLHHKILAGILAQKSDVYQAELDAKRIERFEVVCVDLYPFESTIAQPGVTVEEAIEKIDIGGVTLLRAAAKNHDDGLVVVCSQEGRRRVIEELRRYGEVSPILRRWLAIEAFQVTACYDAAIWQYLGSLQGKLSKAIFLTNGVECRYGSNPHQRGFIYDILGEPYDSCSLEHFQQLNGKEMSMNNWIDLDGALKALSQIYVALRKTVGKHPHVVAGVKHTNPAGASFSFQEDAAEATRKMLAGDPLAIFGGVIMTNYLVDLPIAEILLDTAREDPECDGKDRFLEIIAAPAFTSDALVLLRKKGNLRVLVNEALAMPTIAEGETFVKLRGKVVVEERNTAVVTPDTWEFPTNWELTEEGERAGVLAQAVCQVSKSNTITLAYCDDLEIGWIIKNATGQQSRVACCEMTVKDAGDEAEGAVGASDAFFPAEDGPETLMQAGVAGCITVQGSIADKRVIAICDKGDFALAMHDKRGFVHF